MQTADVLTWLQQDILLKADKMSMASSLELRVPFLDREVFALASTLPAAQRVGRHETKIALRAAAARMLPQATAAMPKQGFITPLAQWLREEPWNAQVREVLNSERLLPHEEDLVSLLLPHLARAVLRVARVSGRCRVPRPPPISRFSSCPARGPSRRRRSPRSKRSG